MTKVCSATVVAGAMVLLASFTPAREADQLSTKSKEVTLKGILMWAQTCVPNPKEADKDLVFFAVEGPDRVDAEVDSIMKGYWTGDALDCDQAQKVNEQWVKRLKFFITPCDVADRIAKDCRWHNPRAAVTGVITAKDGKKWLTPTRIQLGARVKYPAKMLAPDKPLQKGGEVPLVLKVTDKLTLKCVLLPAGRFLQGSPFYQWRYQDEYPHEVVLTRSFYMAEIPVTQEMFEAVIGKNPSKSKGPQFPVEHVDYSDIRTFCKILSKKNGKTVRIPTDSELEYAARVGVSSPCFPEKYKNQISRAGSREHTPQPVKTMKPNAWGLYDVLCGGWTIVSDLKADNVRTKQVDPHGPARGADGNITPA